MTWETLGSLGGFIQGITGFLTLFTIIFVFRQTMEMKKQSVLSTTATIANVYQNIAHTMIELDMELVRNPQLRPYLYENKSITEKDKNYQCVMSYIEAFIDFMDLVVVLERVSSKQKDNNDIPWKNWLGYFEYIYKSCPAMRKFWHENQQWYSEPFAALINPWEPVEPKTAI